MIFTLIQTGMILLILYLVAHELRDAWIAHKEEKKWDEWDRIEGSWDIYIAERGGLRGWSRKPDSVGVKASPEIVIQGQIEVAPVKPETVSARLLVHANR